MFTPRSPACARWSPLFLTLCLMRDAYIDQLDAIFDDLAGIARKV
jgi:hypothetical protein